LRSAGPGGRVLRLVDEPVAEGLDKGGHDLGDGGDNDAAAQNAGERPAARGFRKIFREHTIHAIGLLAVCKPRPSAIPSNPESDDVNPRNRNHRGRGFNDEPAVDRCLRGHGAASDGKTPSGSADKADEANAGPVIKGSNGSHRMADQRYERCDRQRWAVALGVVWAETALKTVQTTTRSVASDWPVSVVLWGYSRISDDLTCSLFLLDVFVDANHRVPHPCNGAVTMRDFRHHFLSKCADLAIEPSGHLLDLIDHADGDDDRSDGSDGDGGDDDVPSPGTNTHIGGDDGPPTGSTAAAAAAAAAAKGTLYHRRRRRPEGNRETTLRITAHTFGLREATALAYALSKDAQLRELVITDASLSDEGATLIAGALKLNSTLRTLDLRGNTIRSDGATALAAMLKVNSTLERLLLEWNGIGVWDTGVTALADALAVNTTMRHLDLRNNRLSGANLAHLAAGLRHNTALVHLDLRWNHAGLTGGRALADLLRVNQTLTHVPTVGNAIPHDLLTAITAALERNIARASHDAAFQTNARVLGDTLDTMQSEHARA
ncbi:RNI-like protein, partial [Caulochytrium protostelioides]